MPYRERPFDPTRHFVDNEKGRTTGAIHSLGVSPATSTRKPRSAFRRGNGVAGDMTNLDQYPETADYFGNVSGATKLVRWFEDPKQVADWLKAEKTLKRSEPLKSLIQRKVNHGR
jgi:hypothetical protein